MYKYITNGKTSINTAITSITQLDLLTKWTSRKGWEAPQAQ